MRYLDLGYKIRKLYNGQTKNKQEDNNPQKDCLKSLKSYNQIYMHKETLY